MTTAGRRNIRSGTMDTIRPVFVFEITARDEIR
jgi:hypothetical protein